jgi:hypothetical protein
MVHNANKLQDILPRIAHLQVIMPENFTHQAGIKLNGPKTSLRKY